MKKIALLVGGGQGLRLGSNIPKQFLLLKNLPVIFHTIEKFVDVVDEIVLVLPQSHFEYWQQLIDKYRPSFSVTTVAGGETRAQSVKNGLAILSGNGLVAVHDAVRPLVSKQLVRNVFEKAANFGNAIPVTAIKDSLRKKEGSNTVSVNRTDYFSVQTPQCFDLQNLKMAYTNAGDLEFSDDAGLMEHFGNTIHVVEGETSNIKITFSEDLAFAEAVLNVTKG